MADITVDIGGFGVSTVEGALRVYVVEGSIGYPCGLGSPTGPGSREFATEKMALNDARGVSESPN